MVASLSNEFQSIIKPEQSIIFATPKIGSLLINFTITNGYPAMKIYQIA